MLANTNNIGNHIGAYKYQTNILDTLKLHNVIWQLYLNNLKKNIKRKHRAIAQDPCFFPRLSNLFFSL